MGSLLSCSLIPACFSHHVRRRRASLLPPQISPKIHPGLQILNSILQPLPPTLPPSPPLSPKRLKRKSLEDDDVPSLGSADSGVKRARVSAEASPPSHSRHSSTHAQNSEPRAVSPNNANAASQSAVKKEEGELEESPSVSRVASSSRANGVNVHRQPRPRRVIDPSAFGKLSETYQMNAKQLKRSATKRRSPNGNSPQGIEFVATLEDTDSILHFAYSFWAMGQQHSRGSSQLLKTWESIQDYISFVNRAWEKLLSVASDPERKGRIKMVMALLWVSPSLSVRLLAASVGTLFSQFHRGSH